MMDNRNWQSLRLGIEVSSLLIDQEFSELVAKLQEKENMLNSMKAELYANRDR